MLLPDAPAALTRPFRRFLLALVLAPLALLAIGAPTRADKASQPIPADTLAKMAAKGTTPAAPILLRAYKRESEIELWKRDRSGRYVPIKTYPICRWSGSSDPRPGTATGRCPRGSTPWPKAR